MDKQYITHIVLRPARVSVKYSERETSEASHLGPSALHRLRVLGLVQGEEIGGELCYSEEEVTQLRRIRRLQHDLGVNLAGVEVILHLLAHLEALEQERGG